LRYDERNALRFKAEHDETRCELEEVSKKARIAELEWELKRKKLLETIDGKSFDLFSFNSTLNKPPLPCDAADRDAELNWLKTLVKQLADKLNAPGDTPANHIAAVEDRVDEVALHGVHLGTTIGLAAMATHIGVDYSMQPRGFQGGTPEDIDDIEVILERLDGHGDATADSIHPQSVLNRLFY
jgi:hypothetical protein